MQEILGNGSGVAQVQAFSNSSFASYSNLSLNAGGGNVGIGTSSPVALLNIYGSTHIQLQNATTGATSADGTRIQLSGNDLQIINRETADTILYTSDTERFRIASTGNSTFTRADNTGTAIEVARFSGNSELTYYNGGAKVLIGNYTAIIGARGSNPDAAGNMYFQTTPNLGSPVLTTALTLAGSGAATFSSSVTVGGTLFVSSGTTNSAVFKGDVAFDGANRFYITNNASQYGRNNLVLTGRLDAANDGYSFGTNCRNGLIFNANLGGAQGATGTEYFSIQLQMVTKALYIQSLYGQTNGLTGFVFSEDNQLRIRNTTSYGDYALQVTGAVYSSAAITATSFFESSDSRLKTLIQDNYQTKGIASITPKLYTKNGKVELGYYAQDFVGILDSAVSKGSDDMLSLSYREVLVAKVYALEQEIKELKAKIN